MANRHTVQKKARGGKASHHHETHEEHEHEIEHEAEVHKQGGAVKKRKSGGRVFGKGGGVRLDKRARGGGVGSDKSPFSSAYIHGHDGGNPAAAPPAHKGGK